MHLDIPWIFIGFLASVSPGKRVAIEVEGVSVGGNVNIFRLLSVIYTYPRMDLGV